MPGFVHRDSHTPVSRGVRTKQMSTSRRRSRQLRLPTPDSRTGGRKIRCRQLLHTSSSVLAHRRLHAPAQLLSTASTGRIPTVGCVHPLGSLSDSKPRRLNETFNALTTLPICEDTKLPVEACIRPHSAVQRVEALGKGPRERWPARISCRLE